VSQNQGSLTIPQKGRSADRRSGIFHPWPLFIFRRGASWHYAVFLHWRNH